MLLAVLALAVPLFSGTPTEVADHEFWVYTQKAENSTYAQATSQDQARYHARRMVRDYYATFLRRSATDAELNRRTADLLSTPPRYDSLGLIMQLYDAQEFDSVHNLTPETSPRDFVRMAFRTILEREPTEGEINWNVPVVLNPAYRRRGLFEILAGCPEAQTPARNGKSEGQGDNFTYTAHEGKLGLLFRGEGALARLRAYPGRTTDQETSSSRPVLSDRKWGPPQRLAEGLSDSAPQLVVRMDPRLGEVWYLFNRDLQYRVNPGDKPTCCGEPFQITVRVSYNRGEDWSEEVPVATPSQASKDDWAIADGEVAFDGSTWHLLAQCATANPGLVGWKICHYSLNSPDPLAGPFVPDTNNPVVRISYPWFWDYPANFGNLQLERNWDDIWRQFVCPTGRCSTADYMRADFDGRYDQRLSGTPNIIGRSFGSYLVAVHGWRDIGDSERNDSLTALVRTTSFGRDNASDFGIEQLQTSFKAVDLEAREVLPYTVDYDSGTKRYAQFPKEMLGPADCERLFLDGGKTCKGTGHASIIRDGAYYYALVEAPTVSLLRNAETRAAGQLWPFLLYRSPRLGATGSWEPFQGGPLVAAKDAVQQELLGYAKLVKTREDFNDPDYDVLLTFSDIRRPLSNGTLRTDFYIFKVTGQPSQEEGANRSWRLPE